MELTITIELNANEIQVLGKLLDAAVRATGMEGAKEAVKFYEKLEHAVAVSNKSNKSNKDN